MAVPQDTVWPADDHTIAKHAILRGYLHAWFAILGTTHGKVVYVDGFSGPGKYAGGEPGSPLIALDAAAAHSQRLKNEVVFLFTDERADRIEHLRNELSSRAFPSNFSIYPEVGKFEKVFTPELDDLERSGDHLAPTFVFMDPFGFSGVPFELVSRILRNPHCEVFITFMVNAVQRFLDHPAEAIRDEIIRLLGSPDASKLLGESGDRVQATRLLYQQRLEEHAAFVRSFEIRDSPGHVLYYLFFATKHRLGHLRMKEAMWGADPRGRFQFVDNTVTDQLVLLDEDPVAPLAPRLCDRFAGETVLSTTRSRISWSCSTKILWRLLNPGYANGSQGRSCREQMYSITWPTTRHLWRSTRASRSNVSKSPGLLRSMLSSHQARSDAPDRFPATR